MNAGIVARNQRNDLWNCAPLEREIHIQISAIAALTPAAFRHKAAETAGGAVGTRRHSGESNLPVSAAPVGRREIGLCFGEIKNRFRVSELEIDTAGADVNLRQGRE